MDQIELEDQNITTQTNYSNEDSSNQDCRFIIIICTLVISLIFIIVTHFIPYNERYKNYLITFKNIRYLLIILLLLFINLSLAHLLFMVIALFAMARYG